MYGSGHVIDMISRMKNNRALRKRRKFKDNNVEQFILHQKKTGKHISIKKISKNKLEKIKRIQHIQAQKQRKKTLIITTLFFLIMLLLISWFIYYIRTH